MPNVVSPKIVKYILFRRHFTFAYGTIFFRKNKFECINKILTERNDNGKGNKIYRNRYLCGSR